MLWSNIQLFQSFLLASDRSGFISPCIFSLSLTHPIANNIERNAQDTKNAQDFLHRELFFNLFFFCLLLKYLPTDDVNINDQLIGVDQRSFAANKFGILLLPAMEDEEKKKLH